MKVAVICEFSGVVRDSFTALGHNAISFDLLPTESLGQHFVVDVTLINRDYWKTFDLAICHPPCQFLTYAGNRYWNEPGRQEKREAAMKFFLWCTELPIKKICVENPIGLPNTIYRKPDQVIHPYYFGEPFQKRTGLWLKNLPLLRCSKNYEVPDPVYICQGNIRGGKRINFVEAARSTNGQPRWKVRSKTFSGIANAMAIQWSSQPCELELFS